MVRLQPCAIHPALTSHPTYVRVKELASERPDVDFVSVDVAPAAPHTPNVNTEFEVYNFLEGIHAEDATFDLVHCRSTMTMVSPPPTFFHHRSLYAPNGHCIFFTCSVDDFLTEPTRSMFLTLIPHLFL